MTEHVKHHYSALIEASIVAIPSQEYNAEEKQAWLKQSRIIDWEKRLQNQKTFEHWEGNQLIAFATLNQDTLDFLFVQPSHWKRGLASQLLKQAEDFARNSGLEKIQIFASKMAFPTCIKAGFMLIQFEHVELENQVLQRFHMEKPLHHIRRNSSVVHKTSRLFMREMLPIDAEVFFNLNNDWEVMKYTGDFPFNSIEASREFLENYDPYSKTGYGRWTLIRKSDGQTIGWCGIKKRDDDSIDLGYRLFKEYWNQGYATEASKKSMAIARNTFGIKELVLEANEENAASRAVAVKLGFEFIRFVDLDGHRDAQYRKIL